jgi:hypothetical protein
LGQRMSGTSDMDKSLSEYFESVSFTAARAQGFDVGAARYVYVMPATVTTVFKRCC